MLPIFNLLAQMSTKNLNAPNDGTPPLSDSGSYGFTWVITLLITVGILFVTFKTSKRNHMDRD